MKEGRERGKDQTSRIGSKEGGRERSKERKGKTKAWDKGRVTVCVP